MADIIKLPVDKNDKIDTAVNGNKLNTNITHSL